MALRVLLTPLTPSLLCVYDRLGLEETLYEILETPVPYILMPVATGRSISNLVEIAARNHVLKLEGHHSAREFARALEHELEVNARALAKGGKRRGR
jgi:HPr kinase/phosphorylase